MAIKPSSARVSGSLETGRLGGTTRPGSFAFHRKQSTQSARASMSQISAKYSEVVRHLQDITGDVLREILEPVLHKAQIYCPVRTGDLLRSGRIEIDVGSRHQVSGIIMFGNAGTKYAAIVHERMDIFHKPPTRAKFLQSAMEEEFGSVLAHAALLYAAELQRA